MSSDGNTVDSSRVPALSVSTVPLKRPRLCYSRDPPYHERIPLSKRISPDLGKSPTPFLTTIPKDKIPEEVKSRFVYLSKRYREYFDAYQSWTEDQLQAAAAHQSDIASSWSWLFECDWHEQAYQELLVTKKMHSCLLDNVYLNGNGERFKHVKASEGHEKYLKKILNFLGKSRDDIGSLSKEEFYDRIMDIKCVVAYHAKNSWRDQTYERLLSLRKKYSYKLDAAYKYVHGGHIQKDKMNFNKEECLKFLEESLDFLANSRADIVDLSEKKCRESLDAIESSVEVGINCFPKILYEVALQSCGQNQEESGYPNWRDLAYEEIQSMSHEFLGDDYRHAYLAWSKIPQLRNPVEELARCLDSVMFFSVSRHGMALLSKDEYERSVEEFTGTVERLEYLMTHLQQLIRERGDPKA